MMKMKRIIPYSIILTFSLTLLACGHKSSTALVTDPSPERMESPQLSEAQIPSQHKNFSATPYPDTYNDDKSIPTKAPGKDNPNSDSNDNTNKKDNIDKKDNINKNDYIDKKDNIVKKDNTVSSDKINQNSNKENNTSSKNNTDASFVETLTISEDIDQLVCVVGNGGADCTVSFHAKDEDGKWQQQFSVDGDCGSNGISYEKIDGDKKTPAGLFTFTLAFGINSDPGSLISYRQITENDYWVDDTDSPYYNTWVNSQETPGDYSSEHLIDHNPSYTYAMNINSNPKNTPGLGSAIFLHCYNGKGQTTGCVAISEKYMKSLIQQLDSSALILIVPDTSDLVNY